MFGEQRCREAVGAFIQQYVDCAYYLPRVDTQNTLHKYKRAFVFHFVALISKIELSGPLETSRFR